MILLLDEESLLWWPLDWGWLDQMLTFSPAALQAVRERKKQALVMRELAARVQLDPDMVQQAVGYGGAFQQAVRNEMAGLAQNIRENLNQDLYRDALGQLGQQAGQRNDVRRLQQQYGQMQAQMQDMLRLQTTPRLFIPPQAEGGLTPGDEEWYTMAAPAEPPRGVGTRLRAAAERLGLRREREEEEEE